LPEYDQHSLGIEADALPFGGKGHRQVKTGKSRAMVQVNVPGTSGNGNVHLCRIVDEIITVQECHLALKTSIFPLRGILLPKPFYEQLKVFSGSELNFTGNALLDRSQNVENTFHCITLVPWECMHGNFQFLVFQVAYILPLRYVCQIHADVASSPEGRRSVVRNNLYLNFTLAVCTGDHTKEGEVLVHNHRT